MVTKKVAKTDDKGEVMKETVSARKAYVDQLKEQAKAPNKFTEYKSYGQRDRQAIKQGIKLAEKGDKETKEDISKEITHGFERAVNAASGSAEKREVVSNITHKELIKISPEVISQKEVAEHLSKRQVEALVKKQELSDKHLDNIQDALQKKADVGDEKALGALRYMKSSSGYIKKGDSVPQKFTPKKSALEEIGFTDQHDKPIDEKNLNT